MTRVFSLLLTLTLVLGGVLGGAFAGGVALGKSQAPDSEGSAPAGAGDGQRPSGQFNRERPGQGGGFGDRSRSGADSSGRQGLRGGARDGAGGRRFGGRGGRPGVSGMVAGIEEGQLTVTTPEGPVLVHLTPETAFQKVIQATLEDVQEGAQIRVFGRPGDDGIIQARSIMLVPEGGEAFPGRRDSQRSR